MLDSVFKFDLLKVECRVNFEWDFSKDGKSINQTRTNLQEEFTCQDHTHDCWV